MNPTVVKLIAKLEGPRLAEANVIRWGSPVPAFGDATTSRVATVGLNPSNREFVDQKGHELHGDFRRFHTLHSLGLHGWSEAQLRHVVMIVESCCTYFERKPYDAWFRQLDYIISGTSASYYDSARSACHLDLIPFATSCKWTELDASQRANLVDASAGALVELIRDSPVEVIVLNGRSVVDQFENLSGRMLEGREMSDWELPRKSGNPVKGVAYTGLVRNLAGVDLGRELRILGFNHNLQSSFGVTKRVRESIREWISREVQS